MRSSRSEPDPLDAGAAGFAHRGMHGPGIPENTLAAFKAALDLGAGIECDVRLSGDGQALVFHDHSLRRMCGLHFKIESTNAEVLAQQQMYGSDERIPLFAELLDLVGGRVPLLVELKTHRNNSAELCAAVAAALADYDGPAGAMSFDPTVGSWLAKNAPGLRRGLVVDEKLSPARRWWATAVARPQFIAAERTIVASRWAQRMRRRKYVYAWTIHGPLQRSQAEVHADALIWESDGRPRV